MSFFSRNELTHSFQDLKEAKQNWIWFLALGILLLILGVGVAGSAYYATVFSVVLFGIFLFSAGIIQFVQAFMARKWSALFLCVFLGAIYLITGFLCITKPETAAIGITFWIAAVCFLVGLFRMIASLVIRFDHYGLVFFNGLVTFLLGGMIFADWPLSGLWVIGLFIGVDLILSGLTWIALSLDARIRD